MSTASLWWQTLAVASGSAVGALLRWQAGLWFNAKWHAFPLGTLVVNCMGGLLVGAALFWFERRPNELLRLLAVTGFLGGLTTFSAFSAESLSLLQRGAWAWGFAHTILHVAGALACAVVGYQAIRALA